MADQPEHRPAEGTPIMARAIALLVPGEREPLAIAADDALALERAFEPLLASDEELVAGLDSILRLAYVVEVERRSPTAARQLLQLIERVAQVAQSRGLKGAANAGERAKTAGRRFLHFAEIDPTAAAPSHDAPVPEGSVKAERLAPVPRRI